MSFLKRHQEKPHSETQEQAARPEQAPVPSAATPPNKPLNGAPLSTAASEKRLRALFEQSPVPIWEEDFSRVKQRLEELRRAGVSDFRAYLEANMDEVRNLAGLIDVIDINQESLVFLGIASKEQIPVNLSHFFVDESWPVVREEMIALAEGKSRFESEIEMRNLSGEHKIIALRLSVDPGYEATLKRVLVSFFDITGRKQAQALSEALNTINHTINSSWDIEEIMRIVCGDAARAIGAESASLIRRKNDDWEISYVLNMPPEYAGKLPPDQADLISRAAALGEPVIISDEDARYRKTLRSYGVKTSLLVPLLVRDELMGIINFNHSAEGASFSEEQVDFANKLAASASLAIESAGLYLRELAARSKIQNHAAQLSILHKIGLSLNKQTDQRRLLEMILESAAELVSAGVGIMALIKEGRTDVISVFYAPWFDGRCMVDGQAQFLHKRVKPYLDSDRDSIRMSDLAAFDRFPEGHLGLRGLLIGTIRDTRGRPRGYFMLSDKAGGEDFNADDEEIISLLAAQSSVALTSVENFEREHGIAEALQSALLPEVPDREDVEVGLLYRSAGPIGKVGGDFYDFIELDDNRIAIAVGDVCGKGLEAATYTAMIKYMLRAYLGEGMLPGDCLTRLNRAVNKQVPIERFVTVSLAIVDTARARIDFSSAGHPPLFICRHGKPNMLKAAQSIPLGVLPDYQYLTTQAATAGVCSIIMYTDGLIEARPEGGEPFGEKLIVKSMAGQCCGSAQKVADLLAEAAVEYSGGALRDDIALLVVKVLKTGSPI